MSEQMKFYTCPHCDYYGMSIICVKCFRVASIEAKPMSDLYKKFVSERIDEIGLNYVWQESARVLWVQDGGNDYEESEFTGYEYSEFDDVHKLSDFLFYLESVADDVEEEDEED